MIDPIAAYTRASAVFGGLVAEVGDDQWGLTTWPGDWTVITTVAWVVVGDAQVPLAVNDGHLDPPRDFDAGVMGSSPVATWRGTALAALGALNAEGAMQQAVTHPDGELVVADLVGQRVSENLVRAHDLARALDRLSDLETEAIERLADWCLDFWAGHASAAVAGGVMPGRVVAPPPDAEPMVRLLALTGRMADPTDRD